MTFAHEGLEVYRSTAPPAGDKTALSQTQHPPGNETLPCYPSQECLLKDPGMGQSEKEHRLDPALFSLFNVLGEDFLIKRTIKL